MAEASEERARRLIAEALEQKGWTKEDLKARRKGELFKVRPAVKL